ncbi:MAG: ammonia-forming cytochrome c nitrite reductase subunit c552 [Pirellulales bacterium]
MTRRHFIPLFILAVSAVIVVVIFNTRPRKSKLQSEEEGSPAELRPAVMASDRGFVSSAACRDCHPKEHESWHRTFHRTMTQLAEPATVLAPFDDVRLESRGRSYTLTRRDDQFFVTTIDPDWEAEQFKQGRNAAELPDAPMVTRPVVMTTGSHHMQGYWFPRGKGNEVLQLPFYYHLAEQRWIPREDVFLRTPERDVELVSWGTICVKCHSVAGIPGGLPHEGPLQTKTVEFGIACESCHGPGAKHVSAERAAKRNGTVRTVEDRKDIFSPSAADPAAQSQICGQCHSEFVPSDPLAFWTKGLPYRAGGPFERSHQVVSKGDDIYRQFGDRYRNTFWNDGTCRVGGDEYNAMIKSPCVEKGKMSCLSCHSMHEADPNDLLKPALDGNRSCQQCHTEPRFNADLAQHTHHETDSTGSNCLNCHMPYTSYALMTALRSHRVTSPRVESIGTGVMPNACNLCHIDRTLEWTNNNLARQFGHKQVELSDEECNTAAAVIWLLKGDGVQRAIAAWHLGWEPAQQIGGSDWQSPLLAQVLHDPYTAVRYQVVQSLKKNKTMSFEGIDFIGSDEQLERNRTEVVRRWLELEPSQPRIDRPALLMTEQGWNEAAGRELLKARDETSLRLPE